VQIGQSIASFFQSVLQGLDNVLRNIAITDVIDVLIVAFFVYKFIRFLRRGRLGLVAKSILFLLAAVWISSLANLTTVHFLTNQALQLGFIALVVLFQPEIRQVLEKVGRSNFSEIFLKGMTDESEMEPVIMQITLAASSLSRMQVGALIAIERKISIEDEAKTGTRLDAKLSDELLKSIFFHNAPLHDGAVAVRQNRIISAGCVLPLSSNAYLSRDLGMRHRAALGLSEKSDAVVVVVSEETGGISVCVDGVLKRNLTQETFEKLLRHELIPPVETKRIRAFWKREKSSANDKGGA